MTDHTKPQSGTGRLRFAAAAVVGLGVLSGMVAQVGLILAPVPQGDAMGMGMQRAFQDFLAWALVPPQLAGVGLVFGLVLSSHMAARMWPLGLLAAADWLVMAAVAGVVVGVGLSPGDGALTGGLLVWAAGFFAWGLSVGASRSWGRVALAVLPLPLAFLAPPLLYLAGS